MDINRPDVLAEVTAAFARYENALVNNQVEVLDELFWSSGFTVRYGVGENLYGIEAIRAFRIARPSVGLARTLQNTTITTFGRDFATAMTEFQRESTPRPAEPAAPRGGMGKVAEPHLPMGGSKTGRQSQTWVRLPEGWRVVAAHVSLLG